MPNVHLNTPSKREMFINETFAKWLLLLLKKNLCIDYSYYTDLFTIISVAIETHHFEDEVERPNCRLIITSY